MSDSGKERIRYIDYMKAVGMILVILGHINFANQGIKAWIYSFHMPLFFFVSGLVLKIEGATSFTGAMIVIRKNFQRLMFPYFLWSLVFAKLSFPNLCYIIYGSYWSIKNAGALSSLWFLPVLFLAIVLIITVQTLLKKRFTLPVKMLLVVASFFFGHFIPHFKIGYPWSVNVAIVAFAIMLFGNFVSSYLHNIYVTIKNHNYHKKLLCSIVVILSWVGTLVYQINIPDHGYILMANAEYGNIFLFMLNFLCGVLMILAFSWMLDFCIQIKALADVLSYVGRNTLCIFALQKPVISCFGKLFQVVHLPNFIMLLVTLFGTLALCSVLCLFINRYLPQFAGTLIKK